jgi:predicted CoA-binding protein
MSSVEAPRDRIAHDLYPADFLKRLLERVRVIGMVGASPEPWRPSFGIMRYLQRAGYRVIPVNPTHAGTQLHGEKVVSSLTEADAPIDLVNVFRRSDAIGAVVEDAIRAIAPAIWLQLGIRNDEAARRAEEAGIAVVMNRCISVEHARLVRA